MHQGFLLGKVKCIALTSQNLWRLSVCGVLLMNPPSFWWRGESWRPPRCGCIPLYRRLSITADVLRAVEFLILLTVCDRWNCPVTFMSPGDGKAGNCLICGLSPPRHPDENRRTLMKRRTAESPFSPAVSLNRIEVTRILDFQ